MLRTCEIGPISLRYTVVLVLPLTIYDVYLALKTVIVVFVVWSFLVCSH